MTPAERAKSIADDARAKRAAAAERNRRLYPEFTRYIDEIRKWAPDLRISRLNPVPQVTDPGEQR